MADKKISALTGATTPLAGTEVLPIVQGGATVKVAVSDLTAGRAISATSITASTGNFVVGTSGQGIDFSATPGTGTSELFADYEEGTYTAAITCGTSGTVTLNTSNDTLSYTKTGRQVTVQGYLAISSVSSPAGYFAVSLPFVIADLTEGSGQPGGALVVNNTVLVGVGSFSYIGVEGQSAMWVFLNTTSNLSATAAQQLKATTEIYVTFTYFA